MAGTSSGQAPGERAAALCLHDGDDVGVMRQAGRAGEPCLVIGSDHEHLIDLHTDIPFGHKVALRALAVGEQVVKYGQPIGVATAPIPAGAHVHIHNLEGLGTTGRGSHHA